jgi:peptide/nickel transport system substrate-binding protein
MMKRVIVLAVAVGLLATACGGGKSGGGSSGTSVTISNEQGTTWTCGFNPFNGNTQFLSFGPVYEELTFVNGLKSGATTNWLASSYAWSNDNKTLTFTIRPGVKWSDGKPLTAADVLFTFNLIKAHPALDLNAAWAVLKDVEQNGDKVVFDFKSSAVPYFYYIGAQTPIVPQHVWSKISDPVTYKDTSPVGSGPVHDELVLAAGDQVHEELRLLAGGQAGRSRPSTTRRSPRTSPANQQLASGQGAVGQPVIPNINKYYLNEEPETTTTGSRRSSTSRSSSTRRTRSCRTSPCGRRWPTQSTGRRSRRSASTATSLPRTRPGIVTPTFSDCARQGSADAGRLRPRRRADADPRSGRASRRSGGIYQTPDGKPLSFRILNIGGYSDWVASVQIIQDELKAVGHQDHAREPLQHDLRQQRLQRQVPARVRRERVGRAGAVLRAAPAPLLEELGPDRATRRLELGAVRESAGGRPDRAVRRDRPDSAKQHEIVRQLEAVMVNEIPVIPVTEGVDWYQYNTKNLSGWVVKGNPFARPAAYETPDWGVMLLHLKPKGS